MTLTLLVFVSIAGAAPFAYVINNDLPSGINVIDTATNKVISYVGGSLTDPGNLTGPGVAVNPAGTKVYVTNSDKNSVSVIDTTINKVIATMSVGSNPYGVAVSPDGTKAYVANSGSNTVSVINATTNKVTATVNVGSSPCGVAVTPDGNKVYVTNSGNYSIPGNTVSVIDITTNKVTATVNVGSSPCGVAIAPDGKKVYVANFGYRTPDNTISVIDITTNKVTATVKLGSTPEGYALCPHEVVITPDGKKVYVACLGFYDSSYVPVIDTSTDKVITNIADGAYDNVGIAITPDGKKVYVVNRGHTGAGYGVSVIDTATNKVSGYVDSGKYMLIPVAFGQFISPSVILPIAGFSATPITGYAPLRVTFTDTSTGTPTSWYWDFGDGKTSPLRNPTHTYSKAGNYSVTLSVVKNGVLTHVTKSNYIVLTSLKPPVASFVMSRSSGKSPLTVYFTDRSTGTITSEKWTFGDCAASTVKNPSHKFTKVGKWKVTLKVTNNAGSSSKYQYVTVSK